MQHLGIFEDRMGGVYGDGGGNKIHLRKKDNQGVLMRDELEMGERRWQVEGRSGKAFWKQTEKPVNWGASWKLSTTLQSGLCKL